MQHEPCSLFKVGPNKSSTCVKLEWDQSLCCCSWHNTFFHISVMPAASDGSIWHPGRRNSLSLSFSFFLGEFLLSICAISVNWLWFDCRVLLSVENLDRWCIELRWLIRKRTVDVLLCDCSHNILCFYSRPKLQSTFLDSYLRSTQYWAVFFLKTSAYEEMNHIAFSSWLHLLKFTLAISVCALKDGDLLIFSAAGSIWEKREQ